MIEPAHPEIVARTTPRKIALRMADTGESLTFGELAESANRMARVFAARGLGHGDAIACLLPNGAALMQVVWAAKNAGLRYVMVGTRLNDADTAYIVRDSGARLLITLGDYAARVAAMGFDQREIGVLLADGPSADAPDVFGDLMALAAACPAEPLPGRKRGASMLYSSGTTGRPKGVKALLADLPPEVPPPRHAQLMASYAMGPDTVFVTAAPMYHAAPLRIAMAVQRAGGTVIAFRKFDAGAMLAAMADHGATHGFFVPTMFQRMLDLPEEVRTAQDLGTMRHAIHGAAPCPMGVKRAMIDWWGPVIDELYGGTESIGQTFISAREWLEHPGSVGRPSGHVEVKIVDEAGNHLPPGQSGRIMMRNPQRFAYHGQAAHGGAESYDAEGFASLGDIGYLDADGYLYLTDRQSNMIISGGVNVYPQEAESVLLGHPDVADVAVIGVPDRDLGEAAKALVRLHPGKAGDAVLAAEILGFCAERLSRYKCPRSLEFVADLPRNELGKLVKHQIPAELREGPGPY